KNLTAANAFLAENADKDGVVTLASGLQYKILTEGPADGASPAATDTIDVHFVGTLIDGQEIDSSRARGAAARFPLDQVAQVFPFWGEGAPLMSEGDTYRFFIPPALAFGERGAGPVEPNTALIYDVELIGVVSPEKNLAKAESYLAENATAEGVKTTDSGLQYKVLTEGPEDGATPNDASVVRVHYRGVLIDGTEFDSSYARGEPAEFPVGGVIAGWTEGLQLMSEGDKFQFFIHPDLAYGANPRPGGAIGPNDALVFDVELLEVK
ncbi:MAG: FKBP-type peptidyl-prolyl cis-trans isomerase, partial [Pseudomonadota bacterium]